MEDKALNIISSVNIEIVKEGRRYVFSIPAGAPFGESFDAAFQAMEVISGWHENAKKKIKESRPEDKEPETLESATLESATPVSATPVSDEAEITS